METYWIETFGCPKNVVDSAKLSGIVELSGYRPAAAPETADVIIVNTCAFIEAARAESIETVLDLAGRRRSPATKVVVTGCMAERYHDELVEPSRGRPHRRIRRVADPRGHPVSWVRGPCRIPSFDLLSIPPPCFGRPGRTSRSRRDATVGAVSARSRRSEVTNAHDRSTSCSTRLRPLAEGGVKELVLVAQDLVSFGRDRRRGACTIPNSTRRRIRQSSSSWARSKRWCPGFAFCTSTPPA